MVTQRRKPTDQIATIIRFEPEIYRRLKTISARGYSMANLVRQCVSDYLDTLDTKLQAQERKIKRKVHGKKRKS
jgi:predicted DNA-binding protein